MQVTKNFSTEEFRCHDGTEYPINQIDTLDVDGRRWLESRLMPLCETLEVIRTAATTLAIAQDHTAPGSGWPITIDSGYRTFTYDAKLYEQSAKNGTVAPPQGSQHPKGRAADIRHAVLTPQDLHALILSLYYHGDLPYLGGLGSYPTFVHVDVRPRPIQNPRHLAQWGGVRDTNVVV